MLEPLHFMPAFGLWLALIFTIMAIPSASVFKYWKIIASFIFLVIIASAFHASYIWRCLRTGLIVPVVMALQIIGYGMGFTTAFFWRIVLRKGHFTGFVKQYYT